MAGICSIVEYALRCVVARFLVDLLPRAIANLLAISNAFERTIISDIFIVRDWEHGQSLTIIRRIFLSDVLDGWLILYTRRLLEIFYARSQTLPCMRLCFVDVPLRRTCLRT